MRRLPIATSCARRCRVGCCYTIWLAPIIRCRSADLVGVQTNFRLLQVSSMRRASAMPHSVGSLSPDKRHSRLTIVRRGCNRCRIAGIHGAAMYTAPTLRSACSHSSCNPSMLGSRGTPLVLSLGGVRGIFSFEKENIPLSRVPHTVWGIIECALRAQKKKHPYGCSLFIPQ